MKYLISITLILILESAHAQSHVQSTGLPAVFLIGEYEDRYLELSEQHPDMFMTVYKNNLDQAYKGWSELLMDIEDYAADLKFDIKGAKLWMNIYFNPDGTISNLHFLHSSTGLHLRRRGIIKVTEIHSSDSADPLPPERGPRFKKK